MTPDEQPSAPPGGRTITDSDIDWARRVSREAVCEFMRPQPDLLEEAEAGGLLGLAHALSHHDGVRDLQPYALVCIRSQAIRAAGEHLGPRAAWHLGISTRSLDTQRYEDGPTGADLIPDAASTRDTKRHELATDAAAMLRARVRRRRDRELLDLLGAGFTRSEIAELCHVTIQAVSAWVAELGRRALESPSFADALRAWMNNRTVAEPVCRPNGPGEPPPFD